MAFQLLLVSPDEDYAQTYAAYPQSRSTDDMYRQLLVVLLLALDWLLQLAATLTHCDGTN